MAGRTESQGTWGVGTLEEGRGVCLALTPSCHHDRRDSVKPWSSALGGADRPWEVGPAGLADWFPLPCSIRWTLPSW